MTKTRITLGALAIASLLLVGVALAAPNSPSIDWRVIGGGGGSASAGSTSVNGTIGQAVVGAHTSAPYELCAGFWCGAGTKHRAYLPLVLKD